ncbi:MAG: hypothetical protein ACO1N7_01450 [Sphingobacteriaceae bacterium]
MQEQLTFKLSDEFLKSSVDIESIKREIEQNVAIVEALLVSYHFKSRGRVFNVQINESSIELIKPVIGRFTVNYSIGQFNACADVDFVEKASMELLYDISIDTSTCTITGEYIPEREPDEF